MTVMTGKVNMAADVTDISSEQVANFLSENPTFFLKNEHLLADLYLPHASGEAVSLLERQVSILRERNIDMRKRANELLEQGHRNDTLFQKTKSLVLDLLDAKSINDLSVRLANFCEKEFQVDKVQLSLIANPETYRATETRVVAEAEVNLQMPSLLKNNESISGVFREEEFSFLFNKQANNIQSAIVKPIFIEQKARAFLSLGSDDARYFSAGMDTLFLNFIADVLGRIIPRFIK
jgi:uncharacterized protein YigA (DUF484 family)